MEMVYTRIIIRLIILTVVILVIMEMVYTVCPGIIDFKTVVILVIMEMVYTSKSKFYGNT